MNNFPYRKKRKGKRPPKSSSHGEQPPAARDESNASADDNREIRDRTEGSNAPNCDANGFDRKTGKRSRKRDPAGNVSKAPQPSTFLDVDRNASENVRDNRSNERGSRRPKNKPSGDGNPAVNSQRGNASARNKNRSESRRNSDGDHFLRNLRAPVKPVPTASYDPDKTKKNKTHEWKGSNTGNRRQLYAALDLGTNNCRLLVALPQERGRFRVIDGYSRIVRLGEGLGHSGSLKQEAMDRAVEALKVCADKLANHSVKRYRLIATEACRQADNGEAFLERVKRETGLDLELINRKTEASLAAEGCGSLMDRKADAGVLFDIGGGSSELMLVNRRLGPKRISDQIVSWHSLPVGVVTLSERFGGEMVNRETFKAMVADVLKLLESFEGRDQLAKIWKNGRVHLLGTSGTVTTLAGIHLELPRYDRRKVDGLWLSDTQIDKVLDTLLSMDYKQRAASPCVGKERADLVMAGCAILEAIRITWPSKRLRVADRGLREGILTQLMEKDGAWIKHRKDRWPRKRQKNNFKGGHSEQ